jgi:hypothetical protein
VCPDLDGVGASEAGGEVRVADRVAERSERGSGALGERGEERTFDDDLDGGPAKREAEGSAQGLGLAVRVGGAGDDEDGHVNATTRSDVPTIAAWSSWLPRSTPSANRATELFEHAVSTTSSSSSCCAIVGLGERGAFGIHREHRDFVPRAADGKRDPATACAGSARVAR